MKGIAAGQLLERGADLTIEDRMSRGLSRKLVAVRPPRYLGERLDAFSRVEVLGHPPARLELYLRGDDGNGAEAHGLSVYAAGTLVAEASSPTGPPARSRRPSRTWSRARGSRSRSSSTPPAPWRSRLLDGRWQVNAGHRDYRLLQGRPVLKLRFLAHLFAKEVVLRSSRDPRFEEPLEQVVEVVAYADRNFAPRGRRPARREAPDGS